MEKWIKFNNSKLLYPLLLINLPSVQEATLNEEQLVTPWDVQGAVHEGKNVGIDYDKLIVQFGCQPLTPALIERFEKLVGQKAHTFIRRGIFFSHRDFSRILDQYEQKKPIYLYTGRGPSSESMHLGHMVPFIVCKYLQDVFDCHLVIQMTDDEKFLWKNLTLQETKQFARENAKDIIAVGFNPEKTFIFVDSDYFGYMYDTVLRVQKCINFNQASSVFGFNASDSIGKIAFPATEIAPAYPSAFRHIFGENKDVLCLIPCAIDQDPYFRLARDVASRLGFHKPASIYSIFFPALQGSSSKMSSSAENTAVFMTDSAGQIKNKINKYAFSGGRDTLEEHRKHGGDPEVDVAFQYLKFFLDDDEELETISREYKKGNLLTGELKKRCIDVLQAFVANFQENRAKITPILMEKFMAMPERQK